MLLAAALKLSRPGFCHHTIKHRNHYELEWALKSKKGIVYILNARGARTLTWTDEVSEDWEPLEPDPLSVGTVKEGEILKMSKKGRPRL